MNDAEPQGVETMSPGDELVCERRGAVLVARLNRPDARNALTPSLIRSIGAAIRSEEHTSELQSR